MRRKAILCWFLIFSFFTADAQWRSGIKAGVNLSRFTQEIDPFARNSEYYDDYIGFKQFIRAGANAGFTLEHRATSSFSVGSELLYSSRGAMYRIRNPYVTLVDGEGEQKRAYDSYTYQVNYIELPLYFQMNTGYFRKSAFDIYAGVAPAYAIKSRRIYRYYEGSGVVAAGDQQKKSKPLDHVRNTNLFPLAGVKAGTEKAYFDMRLSFPLLPVFAKSKNPDGSNLTTRTWSVGLTGGLYF